MKIAVTLFIVFALFLPNTFAQDYTRWSLPEGVKARLGKGGSIVGKVFSRRDSARCRRFHRYLAL